MYQGDMTSPPTTIIVGGNADLGNVPNVNFTLNQQTKLIIGAAMGAGGGGASGWSDAAGSTTTSGGGGGGPAEYRAFLAPKYLCPNVLGLQIAGSPPGGAAARVASNAGTNGSRSVIYLSGIGTLLTLLSIVDVKGGTGGSAATANAGGGGGAAGTQTTQAYPVHVSAYVSGGAGGAGNSTTTPTALDNQHFVGRGLGGAGITSSNLAVSGGAVNSFGADPGMPGGAAATQGNSCPVYTCRPEIHGLYTQSGTGGGSGYLAPGGAGGVGGIGSGGGGGGGSNSAADTGGAGGRGGPGAIILVEI